MNYATNDDNFTREDLRNSSNIRVEQSPSKHNSKSPQDSKTKVKAQNFINYLSDSKEYSNYKYLQNKVNKSINKYQKNTNKL